MPVSTMNLNDSSTEQVVTSYSLPTAALAMYACLGSVGILGNGIVLVVIANVKELRNITNLLIANQSLIDFMSSVFLLVFFVFPQPKLPGGPDSFAYFVCAFLLSGYPFWACILASAVNLVVLTLERYCAVVYPISYKKRANAKYGFLSALIPWLVGLSFNMNVPILSDVEDGTCYLLIWPSKSIQIFLGVITFFMNYLIPLSTMAIVYLLIEKRLRSRVGPIPNPNTGTTQDNQRGEGEGGGGGGGGRRGGADQGLPNYRRTARRSIIKTLFTVIICYAVCWTPNQVLFFYYNLGGYLDFSGFLYYFTVFLAFCNMCINPLIYTLKYNKFRNGLKQVFGRGVFRRLREGGDSQIDATTTHST